VREAIALKNEFYEKWVSPNGLALLGVGEGENANGILFLAFFLQLLKLSDDLNQDDLNRAFNALEKIRKAKGYYKRSRTQEATDSHDNTVGICAISALFDFKDARDIVEVGTENGFNYDHLSPDSPMPRTQHQGGDVAFYKICAKFSPTLWELIWMCGGIIIAGIWGTPSTVNLTWLRLQAAFLSLKKRGDAHLYGITGVSLFFASLVYNIGVRKRFGGIQGSFAKYYRESHPIRRLAKELSL
jgi:hypothetical protein